MIDESTMFSINEFSKMSGVELTTLRYYDDIGVLPPAARGNNNYRYYAPPQLIKLNFINILVNMGVKLSVIKEMDKARTPETMMKLLNAQEAKLHMRLNELEVGISAIHTHRENILKGLSSPEGEIGVEERDDARYALGQVNDYQNCDSFYDKFISFYSSAADYRINLSYPIGGYYNDMNAFADSPGRPERFFSLDMHGNKIMPAGKYLVGYQRGPYGQAGDTPQKMLAYAQGRGIALDGPVFVIYLLNEISVADPEQYLSCASVKIRHGA